jgi:hypothetical protein
MDPRFKTALADSFARCGARVSFPIVMPGVPIQAPGTDSLLTITEVGHETETLTQYGHPVGPPQTSANGTVTPMPEIRQFALMNGDVQYDAYVEAIRRSQLFSEVTLLRADDLPEGEFQGNQLKMSLQLSKPGSQASWNVAKKGGGKQNFAHVPGTVTQANLGLLLNRLSQATGNL